MLDCPCNRPASRPDDPRRVRPSGQVGLDRLAVPFYCVSGHSHLRGGLRVGHIHRAAHATVRRRRSSARPRPRDLRRRRGRSRWTQWVRQVNADPSAAGPHQADIRHSYSIRRTHFATVGLRGACRGAGRGACVRAEPLCAYEPALVGAAPRDPRRSRRGSARGRRSAGPQQGACEALFPGHEAEAGDRRRTPARSGTPRARRAHQWSGPGWDRRDSDASAASRRRGAHSPRVLASPE